VIAKFGRVLVILLGVLVLGSAALADPALYLTAPANGYTQVFASNLSIKYSNIGNNIGQLVVSNPNTSGTLEGGDPNAPFFSAFGVPIMPLQFSLTADFNLADGSLRTGDSANGLSVSGTLVGNVPTDLTAFLHAGANNFYQSNSLSRYGDDQSVNSSITRIDFTFSNNQGQIWPGLPAYVILFVPSQASLTFGVGVNPSNARLGGYTSGISGTASLTNQQILWQGTGAQADVFSPLPRSVYMGFALFCGVMVLRYRKNLQV